MKLIMRNVWMATAALAVFGAAGSAQQLPEGNGRLEAEKLCKQCHEMARSVSKRQDRDGWIETMNKMSAYGMKSSDKDFSRVVDYLTKYFPAEEIPKVNVNTASAIELESGLTLRRSQAAALIAYRKQNGNFKSLDDLKKVPQLESAKLEEKKERIAF